jgi:glutamine synthetase
VFVGPEAGFFIFDDVRFSSAPYNCGFRLDSSELPANTGTEYEMGNLGHRPRTEGGYFPVPPIDSAQDIRSEIHDGVHGCGHGKASPRGRSFTSLASSSVRLPAPADAMQIYKYVIHNVVAQSYRKTATFMPKPVFSDNGSGMHVHQSIWKGSDPVFAGNLYADLSARRLCYAPPLSHP